MIEMTWQRRPAAGDSKLLWVLISSAPYLSHITFGFKVLLGFLHSSKFTQQEEGEEKGHTPRFQMTS